MLNSSHPTEHWRCESIIRTKSSSVCCASFQETGTVRKQCQAYKNHYSSEVTVWCAVAVFSVIGPYFFEDERGNAYTVTPERYAHVTGLLHSSSPRSTSKQNHLLLTRWVYKSHCKNYNEHFAPTFSWTYHFQIWRYRMASKITRIIGVWFLPVGGHLKSVVYSAPSPRTTLKLKLRIQEEISRIPVDVLRRVMNSVHDRLAECEQRNGGHLEDVIFRV